MPTPPTRYTLRGLPSPQPVARREPTARDSARDTETESVDRRDHRPTLARPRWLDLLRGRINLDELFRS